jgi:hypothetical protein
MYPVSRTLTMAGGGAEAVPAVYLLAALRNGHTRGVIIKTMHIHLDEKQQQYFYIIPIWNSANDLPGGGHEDYREVTNVLDILLLRRRFVWENQSFHFDETFHIVFDEDGHYRISGGSTK